MISEIEIAVLPEFLTDERVIRLALESALNVSGEAINEYRILKRSVDARSRTVVYRLKVQVYINEEPVQPYKTPFIYKISSTAQPVYIIGAGPAGLFAALRLIELGLKPIIIERGKDVKERRRDLAAIHKERKVNPDSNYCFGEGGAGTYSDGKLYTRSTKRGDVERILRIFTEHGADGDILIDARPHIGTNKLPGIIMQMRQTILDAGGEVHFDTKLTDLIIKNNHIREIELNGEVKHKTDKVILATGHSARDIFNLLYDKNIHIEAKPFALGVRIEHPQEIIDASQYHCEVRSSFLPPAYYNLVEQIDGRGVFSFCMCPGGIIAPCATQPGEVVVNGWSPSKRNNPFANSGMVVQLNLEDIPLAGPEALKSMAYQKEAEVKAFIAGGSDLSAPAQRMVDFVNNKISASLPKTSYIPGVRSADLYSVLPPHVTARLKKALVVFGKKMKGYYTNEAVLVGVESRTSSPVRIPRDKFSLEHIEIKGLFPCGEGAGYAGGIVSAAIDGERCAEAVYRKIQHKN